MAMVWPELKTESNLAQINTCAPCHSRRAEVEEGFSPGCNFDEYFVLQTINEPIYFADGQIRDEDYVHGSFIQSKMFHNGIKCSDCHDMHSTKLIHSGNQVCTSCHQHSSWQVRHAKSSSSCRGYFWGSMRELPHACRRPTWRSIIVVIIVFESLMPLR